MRYLIAALLLTTAAQAAPLDVWQRKYMLASRNSGGTYSLPNPAVVTGSSISSTWANTTLNDIATELTNSLDRAGRGAMTGPLRLKGGASAAAPDLAWDVETNSGWYRAAAGDFRFALSAVDHLKLTSTRLSLGLSGTPILLDHDNLFGAGLAGLWMTSAAAAQSNYAVLQGPPNDTYFNAAATGHLRIANVDIATWTSSAVTVVPATTLNNNLTVQGATATAAISTAALTIGSGGTAISKSIRGTLAVGSGTLVAFTCVDQSITVTGAVQGAECAIGQQLAQAGIISDCKVTSANVCTFRTCNAVGVDQAVSAQTLSCRVFNP